VAESKTHYRPLLDADYSRRISFAVSMAAGMYAIVAGSLALAGWTLDIPRLTDWWNDHISIFANPAAGGVLCGMALLLLLASPRDLTGTCAAARLLAGVTALIGLLTLFEHITDINLGIDTLLANRPWGQRAAMAPMRMGPPASISFSLLGTGLLLATYGRMSRRIASGLAMVVVGIASLSIVGYWFGASELFGIARLTGIAWQTSTMLIALGIGLMAALPEHGIVAALRRDDAGGTVLRRLIVPIIGVPLLLGWLRVVGQNLNLYDVAFGTALRSMAEIALLIWLLWWTANGISLHAKAARQAEQALREADRRKDEFLAILAHELRNPLAPIGNALALIKHAGQSPEVQHQAHETMERQFGQMVRLVDDLLDISRITRDKLELRTQRVELESVIYQAVETCRSLADGMAQSLRINLSADPIWVSADPVRLAQVFINLLNNACKFSENGATVSLSVRRNGNVVTVTVSDTGIGISPDKIESIFQMFEQVDKSMERGQGGLGIGLTLVKRLVELHGGRIEVSSDGPGRGSNFVVSLPVLPDDGRPAEVVPKLNNTTTKPLRVLVTDDNQDAARSLSMLLKHSGHEVETAFDGVKAIEKAETWRPDVILLDLGMPEMNGYDVCRSIRQMPWGKGIRIVALTGWGQEQDRRNTHAAGFDAHLVKPVDLAILRDVLADTSQA
jgi:signal transduction histidine kinase/ActR/RegA family two-component response regulator